MRKGISRDTLRRLIDDHREAGSIPVGALVDLVRQEDPHQRPSENSLYVMRLYDGYEHRWFDETKPLPWEETLQLWKEKTHNGMERACFGDGQYFDIFPAGTRMFVNHLTED